MFLATTSLKDFWIDDDNLVFLGEWCDPDSIQHNKTMEYIWNHKTKTINAIKKCDHFYEYFLNILTIELNKIHNMHYESHYYRILLGTWLYHYININYDRFITVYLFYKKFGLFDTILLDKSNYYTPFDYNDFINVAQLDEYNLQIFSKVINFLFKNNTFKSKLLKNPIKGNKKIQKFKKDSLKMKILRQISIFLSSFQKDKIIICEPYFGEYTISYILKILIRSRFKIIFDDMHHIEEFVCYNNNSKKETVLLNTNNLFKKYIAENILNDIPSIYLAHYSLFKSITLKKIKYMPKIFYTSISLYGNNEAKFFLAEHYKNIKIISHQHGGIYGWSSGLWGENYERKVSDIFLTAGWEEDKKTLPFGLPLLCKKMHSNIPKNITFITTHSSKYLLRFQYYPTSSIYLKNLRLDVINFFNHIDTTIINNNFIIRPYHTKQSMQIMLKIANSYKNKIQINNKNKISDLISNSKMLIFDHMGTTVLEALFLNKPTVIFIDLNTYNFRNEAKEIIKDMLQFKILHSTSISAAKHINEIHSDIDNWWLSKDVQLTRNKFIAKYAKCEKLWDRELVNIFERILCNTI